MSTPHETEPPDRALMVRALIRLLSDLSTRKGGQLTADDHGRVLALLAVLRRYREAGMP